MELITRVDISRKSLPKILKYFLKENKLEMTIYLKIIYFLYI